MVLQLIMFFMLVSNFAMEQINETIRLPSAIAAKSLDKTVDNYLILNIAANGNVLLGRDDKAEALINKIQVANYMKTQMNLDKARTKPQDWEEGKGRSIIIIRAHKDCSFKMVYDVMQAARQAGYSNLQLRTLKVDPSQN
jgi:biopolymer transport protein ExbD